MVHVEDAGFSGYWCECGCNVFFNPITNSFLPPYRLWSWLLWQLKLVGTRTGGGKYRLENVTTGIYKEGMRWDNTFRRQLRRFENILFRSLILCCILILRF